MIDCGAAKGRYVCTEVGVRHLPRLLRILEPPFPLLVHGPGLAHRVVQSHGEVAPRPWIQRFRSPNSTSPSTRPLFNHAVPPAGQRSLRAVARYTVDCDQESHGHQLGRCSYHKDFGGTPTQLLCGEDLQATTSELLKDLGKIFTKLCGQIHLPRDL